MRHIIFYFTDRKITIIKTRKNSKKITDRKSQLKKKN